MGEDGSSREKVFSLGEQKKDAPKLNFYFCVVEWSLTLVNAITNNKQAEVVQPLCWLSMNDIVQKCGGVDAENEVCWCGVSGSK